MIKHQTFKAKKSLGQNFLTNTRVQKRILDACSLKKTDRVFEIGPGKGALTEGLSQRVHSVIAIEKDRTLAGLLQKKFQESNVEIIHGDILKYSLDNLPKGVKVIGNLPYNISTPILEQFIQHHRQLEEIYITVQLEYGQRLAAQSGSKIYGALSCFVQYYYEPKILFKISAGSFTPKPKVESCFVHLKRHKPNKWDVIDEENLFRIIRAAFSQRRKTIQNSLSTITSKEELREALHKNKIDLSARAEQIDLKDYIELANTLNQ